MVTAMMNCTSLRQNRPRPSELVLRHRSVEHPSRLILRTASTSWVRCVDAVHRYLYVKPTQRAVCAGSYVCVACRRQPAVRARAVPRGDRGAPRRRARARAALAQAPRLRRHQRTRQSVPLPLPLPLPSTLSYIDHRGHGSSHSMLTPGSNILKVSVSSFKERCPSLLANVNCHYYSQ